MDQSGDEMGTFWASGHDTYAYRMLFIYVHVGGGT